MPEQIREKLTSQELESAVERAIDLYPVNFGEYGLPIERLQERAAGVPERNRTKVADRLIPRYLNEDLEFYKASLPPWSRHFHPWFLAEGTEVTEDMVRDRGTVRALTASMVLPPSPVVGKRLSERTQELFDREVIFAIPFLSRLEDTDQAFIGRYRDQVLEQLGTGWAIDQTFLESIGNFRDEPWVKKGALDTLQNPVTVSRLFKQGFNKWVAGHEHATFYLTQSEWFNEFLESAMPIYDDIEEQRQRIGTALARLGIHAVNLSKIIAKMDEAILMPVKREEGHPAEVINKVSSLFSSAEELLTKRNPFVKHDLDAFNFATITHIASD